MFRVLTKGCFWTQPLGNLSSTALPSLAPLICTNGGCLVLCCLVPCCRNARLCTIAYLSVSFGRTAAHSTRRACAVQFLTLPLLACDAHLNCCVNHVCAMLCCLRLRLRSYGHASEDDNCNLSSSALFMNGSCAITLAGNMEGFKVCLPEWCAALGSRQQSRVALTGRNLVHCTC